MKYYLIAGEASGDLHASNLMKALHALDSEAQFRCIGGDLMAGAAPGVHLVHHYKDLAYMGFMPVLRHLPTILGGMKQAARDVVAWQPDVLILVDYPGFNLRVAKQVHTRTAIPVVYYISPKIWAWKEWRIRSLRKYVDLLLSILPFEPAYFEQKHHYPVTYVGNPSVDMPLVGACATTASCTVTESCPPPSGSIGNNNRAASGCCPPQSGSIGNNNRAALGCCLLALLPGSRRQEIRDNLPRMLAAAERARASLPHLRVAIAGAPGLEPAFYHPFLPEGVDLRFGETHALLAEADAALVTSGTATLEAALIGVPQVVCYHLRAGKLFALLRRCFLKVPYVSLVNLILGEPLVSELIADQMTPAALDAELHALLHDSAYRQRLLDGYRRMREILGPPGASQRAAEAVWGKIKDKR